MPRIVRRWPRAARQGETGQAGTELPVFEGGCRGKRTGVAVRQDAAAVRDDRGSAPARGSFAARSTVPAGATLIETMFTLAAEGKTNRKGMPNPFRLAVIARAHFDNAYVRGHAHVRPPPRA